ncbi:hypothetical protein AVEN_56395-1 [Araneus ventricosus]|uniref:Uncharacterized protein n=1 Tax=Araneus ventricosus TaxID=182803 RepID=A0A4Y2SCS4_ARAVE|nr:hypothetical protein AVEN_56395-1 [Araneus ventricosus]
MFIIQYPPPGIGNSFCLVVRMFGSGSKGPQLYPRTATVVDPEEHATPTFSPDGSTTNSIHLYIHQMAAPQLLHQALPNSKSVTHFTAQSLHVPEHTQMEITICAYARSTLIASLIFR